MPFSDITAQNIAIGMLRRSLATGQIGHAYMFMGPESIGKRTTALAFAKALNCTDEDARARQDFCGVCRSCRLIELGQHPDVRLLTPETTGGKTVIPIDAIRTKQGENPPRPLPLREDAQLKPMEGRCKVYIIDPANRPGLQEEAGNALLLTIEEPPPHVIIILVSSRPSAVLPTLVSRCRPVRFHLASHDETVAALCTVDGITPEQMQAISGMAAGRIGWALAVARDPRALDIRQKLIQEIDRVLPRGRKAALRLAETMHHLATEVALSTEGDEEDGKAPSADRLARRNLPELLDIVASCWRDLLVPDGSSDIRINVDFSTVLDRHYRRMTPEFTRQGLSAIMQTKRLIERNANIDLALERLWITILPE